MKLLSTLIKVVVLILAISFLLTLVLMSSLATECQDEEDPGIGCTVFTPCNMSCSTYSLYAENGTAISLWATMSETYTGSGCYNFTFNQSQSQGYIAHLCDGSRGTIKVGNTLRQEVDAVEENQALFNATMGGTFDRVMGIGIGTLIYDLLAELAGGFFG